MRAKDNLDILLDSALATYSDAPTSGLEERILGHTVGEAVPRHFSPAKDWKPGLASALRWRISVPVAAVLLVVAVLPLHIWQAHRAGSQSTIKTGPSPLSMPAHRAALQATAQMPANISAAETHWQFSLRPRATAKASEQPEPLPKQEVFPTPIPLTAQEQALQALVNKSPEEARRSVADAAKNAAEPIQIVALKIPPLSPPDHGGT